MVKVLERTTTESGVVVKGIVETQAELETDDECVECASGSEFRADDVSFVAYKKLDGSWKIVFTGL
jgi:hypothetical protein